MHWAIGRNGIYIEADIEYIDQYIEEGGIRNCAGEGKCAYTSRDELALAYTQMLLKDEHNGHVYNLGGKPITQKELAAIINEIYGTQLSYHQMTVEDFRNERTAALGDFIGTVIAGIYEGIKGGVNDVPSDFEKATGRPHQAPLEMVKAIKERMIKE